MKRTLMILAVAAMMAMVCTAPAFADGETASLTLLHELQYLGLEGSGGPVDLTLIGDTLYGTTNYGGQYNNAYHSGGGSIFSVKTDGSDFYVLHENSGTFNDGYQPYYSGLIANSAGTMLYGVTRYGANGSDTPPGEFYGYPNAGYGNIFAMDTAGNYTALHVFKPDEKFPPVPPFSFTGGASPSGNLALIGDTLYGMTTSGGTGGGTIYSLKTTPDPGTPLNPYHFNIIKNLSYSTGIGPIGNSLIANSAGTVLYGMTTGGGNYDGDGVIFSITPSGTYTPLHTFTYNVNGAYPYGSLTLVGDRLYGMTNDGGSDWDWDTGAGPAGTIFSLNTDGGDFTVLQRFAYESDYVGELNGGIPYGSLTLVGDRLYGLTSEGGGEDGWQNGTLFSMKLDGSDFKVEWVFTDLGGNSKGSLTYEPGSDPIFYFAGNYGSALYKFQTGPLGPEPPLVPEPATVISSLLGLFGFAAKRFIRRKV